MRLRTCAPRSRPRKPSPPAAPTARTWHATNASPTASSPTRATSTSCGCVTTVTCVGTRPALTYSSPPPCTSGNAPLPPPRPDHQPERNPAMPKTIDETPVTNALDHAYFCTPQPGHDAPRVEEYDVTK